MSEIKIEVKDSLAKIYTPFNSEFVRKIKNVGGSRWDSLERCWCFPTDMVDAVREICRSVYGFDDLNIGKKITVKLTFLSECIAYRDSVVILGKTLSRAFNRDSGARSGEDVVYLEGEPTSGGSAKYWCSMVPEGAVVRLHNVSEQLYKDFISKHPEEDKDDREIPHCKAEIIKDRKNRNELIAEKERLLARIAEIDKELSEKE